MAESTWEPGSSLPSTLVADYEAGSLQEIQRETTSTGRQTIHTLTTSRMKGADGEPNPKCPKVESD